MMDQIIAQILETGITSPVVIIILGVVCVYLYKKYEKFTETTQETQQQNLEAITRIQNTLETHTRDSENINTSLRGLQERIQTLETRLSTIDGRSSSEMTSIIRDIDAIKRVLEMCYVVNNRSNRTLDSGIQSYID